MIHAGPWFSLLIGGLVAGVTIALLGSRALGRRRPVVLSTRWFLPSALLLVAIEPLAMMLKQPSGRATAFDREQETVMAGLVVFTAIAAAIVAQRRIFSGYTVFGVDVHTVRRALVASLRGLGLVYELREKRYRLKESGAEIELAEGKPRGTVRIHVRRRRDDAVLGRIIDAIRACLRSDEVALKPGQCTKWIATGLALATACGAGLALLWNVGG